MIDLLMKSTIWCWTLLCHLHWYDQLTCDCWVLLRYPTKKVCLRGYFQKVFKKWPEELGRYAPTKVTFDIQPMDQWTNGLMVQWTNEQINQWTKGPMDEWTNGPIDQWTNGPMEHWNIRPMDPWTNGPKDQWTNWPSDQWTNGTMDILLWWIDLLWIDLRCDDLAWIALTKSFVTDLASIYAGINAPKEHEEVIERFWGAWGGYREILRSVRRLYVKKW